MLMVASSEAEPEASRSVVVNVFMEVKAEFEEPLALQYVSTWYSYVVFAVRPVMMEELVVENWVVHDVVPCFRY